MGVFGVVTELHSSPQRFCPRVPWSVAFIRTPRWRQTHFNCSLLRSHAKNKNQTYPGVFENKRIIQSHRSGLHNLRVSKLPPCVGPPGTWGTFVFVDQKMSKRIRKWNILRGKVCKRSLFNSAERLMETMRGGGSWAWWNNPHFCSLQLS